jgi:F-type H+-transporting ATPase subunit delta
MGAAAKRYAKAVFDLASEAGELDKITDEFRAISALVDGHAELKLALTNPLVDPAQRKALIKTILDRLNVSQLTKNAVLLITDHRRSDVLGQIAVELARLSHEKAGRIQAEVISAQPLSEAQYQRVSAALEKWTGRKISLTRKVDANLIGGVVVRVGDRVFDGSVATRLRELRTALLPS